MRLLWMTDIHLNFCDTQQIEIFLNEVKAQAPDAIVISGDIGEAHNLLTYLAQIVETLAVPVYFVLGNHDYYHGSFATIRQVIQRACEVHPLLNYLSIMDAISLTPDVALVGHDALIDGRYGDFLRSGIILNDYLLIQELAVHQLEKPSLLKTLNQLGDETASHLRCVLPDALAQHRQVFVTLHTPPFQQSVWYEGETPSDDNPYLPHFACKAAGDVLKTLVPQSPDCMVTVLCGHTHGAGTAQILPNLSVVTGGAVYEQPQIQRIFDL